eukprot:Nitzschia sp. Nitz4//scaffold96_size78090//58750//60890//NITZ4_005502-RA/size78090-processed-gene-0.32-mRNA-1//1//CDS//3329560597//4879//frame0
MGSCRGRGMAPSMALFLVATLLLALAINSVDAFVQNMPSAFHSRSVGRYNSRVTHVDKFWALKGGAVLEEEDVDEEIEESDEDEEEEIEEEETPLVKSTQKASSKSKVKELKATLQEAIASNSGVINKVFARGSLWKKFKLPYILTALLNPLTVAKMTRAYFASLFDLDYLEDKVDASQDLRSALEAKAKATSGGRGSQGKKKFKPGQAKISAFAKQQLSPSAMGDSQCQFPRDDQGNPVEIDGLEYYPNFFSEDEQEKLLDVVYKNPWEQIIARRQQFYGQVYYHTSQKLKLLQPDETVASSDEKASEGELAKSLDINQLLPLLEERCSQFFGSLGFPSQILVNEYRNTLGIASHFEDFESFGPIIITISLVNPIYLTLKKPTIRCNACETYLDIQKVLLEPGSILVMQGDARNEYRHGISKYKWIRNLPNGQPDIRRDDSYRRVSLTIRHLLSTRRQVEASEDQSEDWKYQFGPKQGTLNE